MRLKFKKRKKKKHLSTERRRIGVSWRHLCQRRKKMCNKNLVKVFLLLALAASQVQCKHQQQFRRNRNSGKKIIFTLKRKIYKKSWRQQTKQLPPSICQDFCEPSAFHSHDLPRQLTSNTKKYAKFQNIEKRIEETKMSLSIPDSASLPAYLSDPNISICTTRVRFFEILFFLFIQFWFFWKKKVLENVLASCNVTIKVILDFWKIERSEQKTLVRINFHLAGTAQNRWSYFRCFLKW